jgi:hypothetical protein
MSCTVCGVSHDVSYHNVECAKCFAVRQVKQPWAAKSLCRRCANEKHGGSRSRLYHIWRSIRQRTGELRAVEELYRNYRDRGIGMCREWAASFEAFRAWAESNGYAEHLEIDRADNDKGYSPENCRWVTDTVQARNRRGVKLSESIAANVRLRLAAGATQAAVGRELGIDARAIGRIARLEIWRP